MRIDTGQHMRMDQRMKLAPRMIQSMEILQLSSQALEERIEQELSSNPTLELREPGDDPEEVKEEIQQQQRDAREGERELVVQDGEKSGNQADDFERLTNMSQEYSDSWEANTCETGESYHAYRGDSGERDAKLDAMANTAARPLSLSDQLLEQWHMAETTPEIRSAGEYLIGLIDDNGYLRTDRDTLIQQAPRDITAQQIDDALKLLHETLEPPGLLARDLRECLLLQIDAKSRPDAPASGEDNHATPDLSLERLLVEQYLKDIEANRLPRIASATGKSIDDIKHALLNLRQFHPHPGRMLVEDNPRVIRPDAVIEYDEIQDRYVVRLLTERVPQLQINHKYMKMARDATVDRKTRDFVGNNLRSARWIIDAILQRSSTLLRVINVVLEAQREYFDFGPQSLKPLPMTQVADQLGIHVATVSRAVSEKYLETPRGVLPLRMFFSGGTATEAGDAMSWAAVQAKLQEIIDAEDKANPLSDDELVDKLKAGGIEIARRTVAKYRKQLHIPPARQRRQY